MKNHVDTQNGDAIMNIKKVIGTVILGGAAAAGGILAYENYAAYKRSERKVKRLDSYYNMLQQWLKDKQAGTLKGKLKNLSGKSVAIYGMGVLGELLYNELKDCDIHCETFVDKNADVLVEGIDGMPVMTIDEIDENKVDVIIVTVTFAFDEIAGEIYSKLGSGVEIVSLDSILGGEE